MVSCQLNAKSRRDILRRLLLLIIEALQEFDSINTTHASLLLTLKSVD